MKTPAWTLIQRNPHMAMGEKLVLLAVESLADAGGWTQYQDDVIGHHAGLSVRQVNAAITSLRKYKCLDVHTRGESLFASRWLSLLTSSTGLAQAVDR